jgi:hypothetical protein
MLALRSVVKLVRSDTFRSIPLQSVTMSFSAGEAENSVQAIPAPVRLMVLFMGVLGFVCGVPDDSEFGKK